MARILVIDDDAALLASLDYALTAAGHSVATAPDGEKAGPMFRAEPFDLIITDMIMPDREGIETIMALHRDFPRVGVIAMSGGLRSRNYLNAAKHLGAHRVLTKPFTAAQLHESIAAVLGRTAD